MESELVSQVSATTAGVDQWIPSKHDLLMDSLTKFFRIQDNIRQMLPIVQGKSSISLRILDWFVTNFCKKRNVVLDVMSDKGETRHLMIYLDYKSQLKAYSKKQFDPFCRRERIRFVYQKSQELITTVGQLNFFRWLIMNRIIDYIDEHLEDIENDMNASIRSHQRRWNSLPMYNGEEWSENVEESQPSTEENSVEDDTRIIPVVMKQNVHASLQLLDGNVHEDESRRKRHELSISATKTVNKHNVKILVEFN